MNLLTHLTMSVETVAYMAPPSDFRLLDRFKGFSFHLGFGGQLECVICLLFTCSCSVRSDDDSRL